MRKSFSFIDCKKVTEIPVEKYFLYGMIKDAASRYLLDTIDVTEEGGNHLGALKKVTS